MSAAEFLLEKQLLEAATALVVVGGQGSDEQEEGNILTAALIVACVEDMRIDRTVIQSVRGRDPRINDVSETEAWVKFRFRKPDLWRLFEVLNFPLHWQCQNGSLFSSETAFLLLLRRLRYPGRLCDLEVEFGREYTQLSRLFGEVVDFVCHHHMHLLTDNLGYWVPVFATLAAAIEEKGGVGCVGSSIFGFLDGTLRRCCRQQGHDDLQRETYDGHHRAHGIAFQSLVLPNGLIADLWGPASGRRHDAYLLQESNLNERLRLVQMGNPFQGMVYGDAAYPVMSHIDRGFRGANLTDAQRAYNTELSRVRISVEWQFGKIAQLFPFVDYKQNLQLLLQPIGKYYVLAALLANAHTTCYGSITSTYFGLLPPSLEEYFRV